MKRLPVSSSFDESPGFTLIEVLVSMVIIFAVVTASLLSYRVAMEGSVNAAERLRLERYIPAVRQHTSKALTDAIEAEANDSYEGQSYIGDADVIWNASLLKKSAPAPKLDPDIGGLINYEDRYFLYRIDVELVANNKLVTFSFDELVWLEDLEEVE